jgi:hypothetical protein
MIFRQEKLLWMLCFGFVSGHDFSGRKGRKENWASGPAMAHSALPQRLHLHGKEKAQGVKAQIFVGLNERV